MLHCTDLIRFLLLKEKKQREELEEKDDDADWRRCTYPLILVSLVMYHLQYLAFQQMQHQGCGGKQARASYGGVSRRRMVTTIEDAEVIVAREVAA